MSYLDQLANRIGPRLSGSHGMQVATEWARARFEALGLSDVHLERCGEVPVGFDRGPSSGRMLRPLERELQFSTPAWTAGTRGRVRARAMAAEASSEDWSAWLSTAGGAWVLWRPSGEPERDRRFLSAWDQARPEPAGLITPSAGALIHTFGDPQVDPDHLPTVPRIVLLQEEFDQVAGLLAEGREVELEFDIRNHFSPGPVPLYNVVADLPGSDRPDQYVIVGAHLDSLDGGTGATDDGTGVAAVLEAARLLRDADARPRRTIRFLLFAGEETGLVGSRAYVRDHPELLPSVSAVLVMDRGGAPISGMQVTPDLRADLERAFAPVPGLDPELSFALEEVERLPSTVECGEAAGEDSSLAPGSCGGDGSGAGPSCGYGSDPAGCGNAVVVRRAPRSPDKASSSDPVRRLVAMGTSDHAPFLDAGVPAFLFEQQAPGALPYLPHTQLDTYDRVDPRSLEHSAAVIALGAEGIADLGRLLPRQDPAERGTSAGGASAPDPSERGH